MYESYFKFFAMYKDYILAPRKYFVNFISEGSPYLMLSIQTPTKDARYFETRKENIFRSLNSSLSSDFEAWDIALSS